MCQSWLVSPVVECIGQVHEIYVCKTSQMLLPYVVGPGDMYECSIKELINLYWGHVHRKSYVAIGPCRSVEYLLLLE